MDTRARTSTALVRPFSAGEFPELDELDTLIQRAGAAIRVEVMCEVSAGRERLPVYLLEFGSAAPDAAAVGFFGGVHGVERIGSQVVLAYLHTLVERLRWDECLHQALERVRIVFMPLVNPGGMLNRTRCNPAGVDLMRNAPVEAEGPVHWLAGGQRFSRHLPWYRGAAGEAMQPEAQAVCRAVQERLLTQPFSLALDCHSGFGTSNHIWFPYARTRRPIEHLAEVYALRTLFRSTHPHHSIYIIEPQSRRYTTHGDLWDHLYDHARAAGQGPFLPLTLEMGSWLWLKKNPLQVFGRLGMFNPIAPHRLRRILRQHLTFFDFLVRAAASYRRWRPPEPERRGLHESAVAYWLSRSESLLAVTDPS